MYLAKNGTKMNLARCFPNDLGTHISSASHPLPSQISTRVRRHTIAWNWRLHRFKKLPFLYCCFYPSPGFKQPRNPRVHAIPFLNLNPSHWAILRSVWFFLVGFNPSKIREPEFELFFIEMAQKKICKDLSPSSPIKGSIWSYLSSILLQETT